MADCPDNEKTLSAAFPETGTSSIVSDVQKTVTSATPMYDIANKMSKALQDYNALNSVVNQLVGYEVRWFRAVPQQRSKDVIFQEYTLSNVEESPLCIKVVLGSGMPPDSKYNYDLMGYEYEVPFEVQIDKKYWESMAGYGTAPQKKDIVYFPISNKLFQVESAYLLRGFMEQETTWKINLTKYQPMASRKESIELQATIDQYTVSEEEIFGEAINNDIKKLVDDQQMNAFNSTSRDKYKTHDASLCSVSSTINMYGTLVAQSLYDLQTPVTNTAVTYNASDYITDHSDRSVLAWIMPRTIPSIHKEYTVSSIYPNSFLSTTNTSTFYDYNPTLFVKTNYSVTLANTSVTDISVNQYVVIAREGELSFYAKIVAITQYPLVYHLMINKYVLQSLGSIKSDWPSQKGYKLTAKSPINILEGIDTYGNSVFSFNIYANQFIGMTYGSAYTNENEYVVRMDEKLDDDTWYGVVINVGNEWKQYSTYVWEKHSTDRYAKLQNKFYQTSTIVPENIIVDNFKINKSPAYLTNLRLYSVTIEEERQSNELLTTFVKDADQAIILDNCDDILRIPYVTRQR